MLQEMEDAGHEPPVALLESCLQRAERQGDEAAIKRLMDALELQAYKIIGAAAKVRRGAEAGRKLGINHVSKDIPGAVRWQLNCHYAARRTAVCCS
jgi:DUF1009 family protein